MIEEFVDVSRIVTGKLLLPAAIEVVCLHPPLPRDLTWTSSSSGERYIVSGDRDRMQQIVWNLLSNALSPFR